jgi:hypothetical protein
MTAADMSAIASVILAVCVVIGAILLLITTGMHR